MHAEITGVTSMAARHILEQACRIHTAQGGTPVCFSAMGGVEVARRLRDGLDVDIVALADDALVTLEADGLIRTGSRIRYASSGIAIAIPAGAPRVVVTGEGDVRAAMLGARRVAISSGPSGTHIQDLWTRWGIAEAMRERTVWSPAGTPVAAFLARGDADLGLQQFSELLGQPGIEILGPLPDALQLATTFAAALAVRARDPDGALAFLRLLHTHVMSDVIVKYGMTPIR